MRRFFGYTSAVSLLICAAVGGLWIGTIDSERPENPPLRPMQERLASPMSEMTFDGVEFRDVMNFVRDVGFDFRDPNVGLRKLHSPDLPLPPPADLDVDWTAIEAAGVGVHTPVTYSARWIPLGTVLVDIVNARGLSCRADATMIHVSSKPGLQRAALIERARFLYTPRDRAARLALNREMPARNLRGATFRVDDALHWISEVTGLPVKIDWRELERMGRLPDVEIVPAVERVTAANFLTIVLRDAYGPGVLQYEIRNGAIVVAPPQTFDAADAHRAMHRWIAISTMLIGLVAAIWLIRRGLRALQGSPDSARVTFAVITVLLACGTFLIMTDVPADALDFEWLSRRVTFACGGGAMQLWVTPSDPMSPYQSPPASGATRSTSQESHRWGFAFVREPWPLQSYCVTARCKPIALGAAILPWSWSLLATARGLRRRQWRRAGRCVRCGYDLRATTGRCPECGNVADSTTKAMMREC